jgi:hypothetical protein
MDTTGSAEMSDEMLMYRKISREVTEDLYAIRLRNLAEKENMVMYQVLMGDAYRPEIKSNRGLRRKYGLDFKNSN